MKIKDRILAFISAPVAYRMGRHFLFLFFIFFFIMV